MNILVVDDDNSYLDMLQSFIGEMGHAVDTANNTKDAESMILKNEYDSVLVDVRMPNEGGIDFINRMSGNSSEFYILTGDPSYIDKSCSCRGFILKDDLASGIKAVLLTRRNEKVS